MIGYNDALLRAWPILMEAVRMRRTVSYSELAGRAGSPLTSRAIHRQLLHPLSLRCVASGLPNLTALVVRKSTGLPGGGWFDPTKSDQRDLTAIWAEAVLDCYAHRWPKQVDPRLNEP